MDNAKGNVRFTTALMTLFVVFLPCNLSGAEAQDDQSSENIVFEDKFDQEKLGSGWSWLREDRESWRFHEGALEVRIEPGLAENCKNVLLREVPDRSQGDYAIEVTVTSLKDPIQQYEQAGLTWYSDGKPVLKLVKELVDGELMIIPGRKPMDEESVRLRLVVTAESWTALYQPGEEGLFLEAGSGDLPPPGKDQVALTCYNGPPEAEHWVRYEDFRVSQIGK